jgi:hypothetical protein
VPRSMAISADNIPNNLHNIRSPVTGGPDTSVPGPPVYMP